MNIFWGAKILWILFWGHHKIRLYFGSFLCILGSLLKVKVQNFFGVLEIPVIFGMSSRCWA